MVEPDAAQDVIERGQRAAELLSNSTFIWLIDDQTKYNLAALIATAPGARGLEARERHHLQQHALTELVSTLQGYIAAGEAMQQALVIEQAEQEDDHS